MPVVNVEIDSRAVWGALNRSDHGDLVDLQRIEA
jgi:hypothetical protein